MFKKKRDHRDDIKELFNSPQGVKVLNILAGLYNNRNLVDETTERTYYRLGQADLVNALIEISLGKVEPVDIITSDMEYKPE